MEINKLPTKSVDLLRYLEQVYPDKVIAKELSPYEQGLQHGVINLIRHLQQVKQGE